MRDVGYSALELLQIGYMYVYRGKYYFHSQFPINKTMTKERKRTKTKTFVSVVALKRAVLKFKVYVRVVSPVRPPCLPSY